MRFLLTISLLACASFSSSVEQGPGPGPGITFGPYNITHENENRTKVTFVSSDQLERLKQCPSSLLKLDTDLSFYIQRDDSKSTSTITYWRFDLEKLETFTFNIGYSDHTHVTYNGYKLKCTGNSRKEHKCNNLPLEKSVPAVVISVDFNPRNGSAFHNQWFRSQYSLHGSYYHSKCQPVTSPWLLQEKKVCFGARGDTFGTVHLQQEGKLTGLMLVHRSGYISCAPGEKYKTHWGCIYPGVDIGVFITDKENKKVFPKYATYPVSPDWFKQAWYFLPGYNAMSPKLVFTDISTPMYVFEGQELRIWYGEDLINISEENDSGVSCADVYAQYS